MASENLLLLQSNLQANLASIFACHKTKYIEDSKLCRPPNDKSVAMALSETPLDEAATENKL